MKNCLELNWPTLGAVEHKKIIDCFKKNINSVYNVNPTDRNVGNITHSKTDMQKQRPGFYHLFNWKNYIDFFRDLLKDFDVCDDSLKLLSIQQSYIGIAPHSDVGRNFIVYYLVEGTGDSVFYHSDNFESGKVYFNRKELTEIERITMKPGRWYLFNNQAIHTVENMSMVRYSLAFDISKIIADYQYAYENIENSKVLFL